jgi:hypothetical protein
MLTDHLRSLVLDFFGRGKRADCQQRSKIENEDEDEDDWRGAYTALTVRYVKKLNK